MKCFEDLRGKLHRTEEECKIADNQALIEDSVIFCTYSGNFDFDDWVKVVRGRPELKAAIIEMFEEKQ